MSFKPGILVILFTLILSSVTHAKGTHEEGQLKASGSLNLHSATQLHAKTIPLRINEETYGDISLYHSKAHNMDSVRGAFSFHNDSHKLAKYKYRVILKDRKGIVAQTRGTLHIAPGHTQKIKISNIVLRERDIKSISEYEILMTHTH